MATANPILDAVLAKLPAAGTTSVSVHGPYEDALIAGFSLIEKLIDGQSAEQKKEIWQGWIDFWKVFGIGK